MKKKASKLFLMAAIALVGVQYFFQLDGIVGLLLVNMVVLFVIASVYFGGFTKEFFLAIVDFFL